MQVYPSRRRLLIAYVALYLAFAAATARATFELWGYDSFGPMLGLLGFYLLTLLVEPTLIARNLLFLHLINGLQTIIALVLVLFIGDVDYFSLLFIPPCTQSILNFPRRTAFIWIGVINLLMIAALLASFPLIESVGYVIIYPTANFLFTALSYLAKQAGEAQDRSELLLADLQKANQKLKNYAEQVEELAASNERNRLARELHDSVTQNHLWPDAVSLGGPHPDRPQPGKGSGGVQAVRDACQGKPQLSLEIAKKLMQIAAGGNPLPEKPVATELE